MATRIIQKLHLINIKNEAAAKKTNLLNFKKEAFDSKPQTLIQNKPHRGSNYTK
jgi:hypothetical protein